MDQATKRTTMKTILIIVTALALSSCKTLDPNKDNDIGGFPSDADWSKIDRTFVPGNSLIE